MGQAFNPWEQEVVDQFFPFPPLGLTILIHIGSRIIGRQSCEKLVSLDMERYDYRGSITSPCPGTPSFPFSLPLPSWYFSGIPVPHKVVGYKLLPQALLSGTQARYY